MSDVPSVSSRPIPPPLIMLLGLLLELALGRWLPLERWLPAPARYAGAPLLAVGVFLSLWAALLFRRAHTGLRPFSPATQLVARGPYRFTRNPMYLGMTILLVGVAIMTGALTPFLVPPLFMIVITLLFIRYEEAQMHRTFGADYDAFKRKVRRWL
jgi:protein-S-isoprenylcysteine O-methyltransferase Ste14